MNAWRWLPPVSSRHNRLAPMKANELKVDFYDSADVRDGDRGTHIPRTRWFTRASSPVLSARELVVVCTGGAACKMTKAAYRTRG